MRIRDVYSGSRIRVFSHPGSEFFSIPDPNLFPSRISEPNFFHPGSRICVKEFKCFNPKKWYLSSRKYDPSCSSRIRILIFAKPRSWVKKALDPGSESATLIEVKQICDTGLYGISDADADPDPASQKIDQSIRIRVRIHNAARYFLLHVLLK